MMSKKFNCLLIDDDTDDHEFFLEALKRTYPEARCEFALDYPTAVSRLRNHSIDIPKYIFMDWSLPNTDLKESLKYLNTMDELKQSAIFILSGSMPPLTQQTLQELGIEKVLLKQNSIHDLSKELWGAIH
ncbi:response regulator [Dyadobacter sp. 32]|uniref:response regulator n=1 Tax=Dyadobacter sp. 32 TaxID=538966 RepID=UPI0011EFB255